MYFMQVPNQLREFTEEDLKRMTNDFTDVVGRGAFGCVYRGIVDHTPVAVKVINPVSCTSHSAHTDFQKALQNLGSKTFKTELDSLTIGTYNLLCSYCGVRAALVYPFMDKFSLFHALHEYKVSNLPKL